MNMKDIKALAAAGKIRGYKALEGPKRADLPGVRGKTLQRDPGHKGRLGKALDEFCRENGLALFQEQRFHESRKWRIDWMIIGIPGVVLGIEYEGLSYKKSGHTTSEAYSDNTVKYNAAAASGIKILRYTYSTYNQCIEDLKMFWI